MDSRAMSISRPGKARRETLVSEHRVCIGKERRQFPKARTRPCGRRKSILSQGVKLPSRLRSPAMRPPSCKQFHTRALCSNPSKESDKSCAVCMSVCMQARLCVCVRMCHPHSGRCQQGPLRGSAWEKQTSRFCTMNDLLRQAHPNTLVPGGGRDPFCAHQMRQAQF